MVQWGLLYVLDCRGRLVVRTPRCGRGNPGSSPGHGRYAYFIYKSKGLRRISYNYIK